MGVSVLCDGSTGYRTQRPLDIYYNLVRDFRGREKDCLSSLVIFARGEAFWSWLNVAGFFFFFSFP